MTPSVARRGHAGRLLTTLLMLSSCAGVGPFALPPSCPVSPVATTELPQAQLRARMHFVAEDEEVWLEVVVRSTPAELRIAGIAAHGVRLFSVHQRGGEIRVESASSGGLEYLALCTLDALHRSLWLRPPKTSGSGPMLSWQWEDEVVHESTEAGERHREFSRTRASSVVRVDYSDRATPRISVANPWCGYRALMVIVDSRVGPFDD